LTINGNFINETVSGNLGGCGQKAEKGGVLHGRHFEVFGRNEVTFE